MDELRKDMEAIASVFVAVWLVYIIMRDGWR